MASILAIAEGKDRIRADLLPAHADYIVGRVVSILTLLHVMSTTDTPLAKTWHRLQFAYSPRAGGVVLMWLTYVGLIEAIAVLVVHDDGQRLHREPHILTTEQLAIGGGDTVDVPNMARWDSFWYHAIATTGYQEPGSPLATPEIVRSRLGFLPLYPVLMRTISEVTGISAYEAGLWISRLCLLAVLILLRDYYHQRSSKRDGNCDVAPIAALLSFPAAFLLVAVYTEALFSFLVLLSFVAANKRWYYTSAGAAALASLTRINGLALLPSFFILAVRQHKEQPRAILPFLGAALGQCALVSFYMSVCGDPLGYLHVKDQNWGVSLAFPWSTVSDAMLRADGALDNLQIGSIYILLELPMVLLIIAVAAIAIRKGWWEDAAFVVGSAAMSLISGSLWGMPRFALFLFPIFIVISLVRKSLPHLYYAYLIMGAVLQGCLLVNYVNFERPAP